MVMQPTDVWDGNHPSLVWGMDGARLRTIHRQGEMGPPVVIIGTIVGQDALQMLLVQDDHMIQALTPDTSNQPLDVGVLPWTRGYDDDFFDPYMLDALPKGRAVDVVAVTQEIPWCLVPGKRFDHLLRRLLRSGMLCHVDVDDPPCSWPIPFHG